MSWKDRLENIEFTITTGDGKVFKPLWKNGEKSKDFNVSKYDFINVPGSFIDRKKPQGSKYPLVFWFQGDDNIDQSDVFEESANDNRPWTIQHPFYGTIKGQPTNLRRSDISYNVTEVSVEFWESISDDFPLQSVSIKEQSRTKVDFLNLTAKNIFIENAVPRTSDIEKLKSDISVISSLNKPDSSNFNDFKNKTKTALINAEKLVTDKKLAFESAQAVITATFDFVDSVSNKVTNLANSYQILKNSITNIFEKTYFEAQASTIISTMCSCAINPQKNDYLTRNDVERVNTIIVRTYEDYLQTLDDNQVDIYDTKNSWTPDVNIQSLLIGLIHSTSIGLFQISFNAKQERIFELTEDSNLIILTHRFLGLDINDDNIETLRVINNIKNDELYQLKKGRLIKYFV